MADMLGIDRRINKANKKYQKLKKGDFPSVDKNIPNWWRYSQVIGENTDNNENKSIYNCSKYLFFLNDDAPPISARCCEFTKKKPAHKYSKKTGRMPITAQMASESKLRTAQWLKNGCNGFEMKNPISNPMSFWTDQDVLLYIKQNNLPICSVYGNIVEDNSGTDEVIGQLTISDLDGFENMEMFDAKRLPLKTTGCKRTGCMFCGYGAHCKGDTRFEDLKRTHPYQYNWIMKDWDQGGLGYKKVIDWINENGNLNIKY